MSAEDEGWGNPTAKHFVRRYVVDVRYEGRVVHVHRGVAHIMAAFLAAVSETFQEIPENVLGWVERGTEAQKRGLRMDLPGLRWLEDLQMAAARLGLTVGDGYVQFDGVLHEAEAVTRMLIEERTTAEASIEVGFVDRFRPGTRPLGLGDTGPDVYFLQEFLQADDRDAVFGHSLEARVKHFQSVRGLEPTGVCDEAFWLAMFPARTVQVEPGSAGMWSLMVNALLAALDYSSEPVTRLYGTRTTRAVRDMQKLHGLRVTGMIRGPEWGVLVHRPVGGFPLAD